MTEPADLPAFLALSREDQREAYLVGSEDLSRSATVLEKDVWVCWTFDALFRCPDVPDMAFKGGTSHSKIFNAISRFSEDIDVTVDHSGLAPDVDPYDPSTSQNQRDRDDKTLRKLLCECSNDLIAPHLRSAAVEIGMPDDMLEIEDDGAVLNVRYPHLVNSPDPYYREGVKIEFGGRNMIEPNERHTVVPYMAQAFDSFAFPVGEVSVLSPMRTFWEKLTLAHAESNRPDFKNADRKSRHWYDLAVLADHDISRSAILEPDLLADVIRVKNRFYKTATARYELCARRLQPPAQRCRNGHASS